MKSFNVSYQITHFLSSAYLKETADQSFCFGFLYQSQSRMNGYAFNESKIIMFRWPLSIMHMGVVECCDGAG